MMGMESLVLIGYCFSFLFIILFCLWFRA